MLLTIPRLASNVIVRRSVEQRRNRNQMRPLCVQSAGDPELPEGVVYGLCISATEDGETRRSCRGRGSNSYIFRPLAFLGLSSRLSHAIMARRNCETLSVTITAQVSDISQPASSRKRQGRAVVKPLRNLMPSLRLEQPALLALRNRRFVLASPRFRGADHQSIESERAAHLGHQPRQTHLELPNRRHA